MTAIRRALMIGGSGMAHGWIRRFLPTFAPRVRIVALADVNPDVLKASGDYLELPASARFTSMADAFARVEADCAFVVIPPAFHEEAIVGALDRGMTVLTEKPLADTWEACARIASHTRRRGGRVAVIQNYRYTAPMLQMRDVLRAGTLGRINHVVGRFAADYRALNSWGAPFRHQIPHGLLVEGAIHHFDMLRNLCGADATRVMGQEWNPPWSSSHGAFCAHFLFAMANGARGIYEGNGTAAGTQNTWHQEMYRAECEGGAIAVDRDRIVRLYRHERGRVTIEELPPVRPAREGHEHIIASFLDWMDGGAAPETVLHGNLKSAAMLFGAIRASEEDRPVDLEAMVDAALGATPAPR